MSDYPIWFATDSTGEIIEITDADEMRRWVSEPSDVQEAYYRFSNIDDAIKYASQRVSAS